MKYGTYRGQELLPAPYICFTSRIGIRLFVGRTSPRGIRKAREMGVIDSVSPLPTLISTGKIDFIAYSCDNRRPKGDRRFPGEEDSSEDWMIFHRWEGLG